MKHPNEHAFTALQALNWDESLTNFHPNEHAFTVLQALNWDESLTNFHPNMHAAQRHKTE
jgi:hypothetical protein